MPLRGAYFSPAAGSDLGTHCALGTVFAGYHTDLNLLTIHGRSRYPGLFVWLRSGRRIPVRIPQVGAAGAVGRGAHACGRDTELRMRCFWTGLRRLAFQTVAL